MRNKIYKVLATTFAMALVVVSPNTCITSHAFGFNADAGYGEGGSELSDDRWSWMDEGSSDSGSSDSGSSDSGASSEPSYEEPSYSEPSHDSSSSNESNDNSGSSDNGSSYDSSSSTASAPAAKSSAATTGAGKKGNDVTVNVTGGQSFRIVTASDRTSFQIYHCGISRASFKVTDANGNAVAFSSVILEKGQDNLWYASIKFAESVDTKDFTVTVTKGDATYLSANLGVSGIKINDVLSLSTIPATDAE